MLTEQISCRLGPEELEALEARVAQAKRSAPKGLQINRSDVIRALILHINRKAKGKTNAEVASLKAKLAKAHSTLKKFKAWRDQIMPTLATAQAHRPVELTVVGKNRHDQLIALTLSTSELIRDEHDNLSFDYEGSNWRLPIDDGELIEWLTDFGTESIHFNDGEAESDDEIDIIDDDEEDYDEEEDEDYEH
jgi:hypothetical protein